ncbi:NTP transferase domain-containing protein [candidate division WOR-3 bacterium]|uniref:NTP transferase domain-containing protein n=1 Tax=candidate division WOR-3 bacterium TaxID=2052148 RepID=A0A9D5K8Y6_UNCW3|nr:NTP transferase domain-containing protein [candidate division WOR-3 bacterium]MBD3364280.1 NTP transferase domain-containing protein [candidate division WOR-3 bacterium]
MKVIIPAAGKGTRLRPFTLWEPKPMLFVAGDSIIGHILSILEGLEIDEYRIVINPEGSMTEMLRKAYPGKPFSFHVQDSPLGLGHAVLQGLAGLGDEPVLVLLADTIIPFNLQDALASLGSGEGFLVAKQVDDPSRFGVIEKDGDFISRLVEKPKEAKSRLAICGIYYLASAERLRDAIEELVAKDIRTAEEYQFTDALSILIEEGERLRTVEVKTWIDCGTSDALLDANRILLKRNSRVVTLKGLLIKPPCWIADDVKITNSIVGPYVSVARGTEITDSILSNCIINRHADIQDSVLKGSIVGFKGVVKGRTLSADVGPFTRIEPI